MKGAAALATLALLLPRLGQAQSSEPWAFRYLVFPAYNSLEKASINLLVGWHKPPPLGAIPRTASINLTGRLTKSGTHGAQLALDWPGRWRNWRLLAIAGTERAQRAPYYGIGNDTELNDSLEAANGPVFYHRYSLLRTTGSLVLQRRLAGPLRLHLGTQWRHYRAQPLAGGRTALGDDLAGGAVTDTGSANSLELRLGLLLDTRDEEASPSRGVFLEALAARALHGAGDFAYTRYALAGREFVPLGEFTVLGFRQSLELADGRLPFYIAYERLTSWRPEDGFGGGTTLRANLPGRWLAANKFIASVDLRYKKLDVPLPTSPLRLWLLAFADVGAVWREGESLDLGGLHGGIGVGFRLQFSKGSMFGTDLGWSPDRRFEFATAITFAY